MPVYEYQCNDCSQRFELFIQHRMISDGVVCRHCHSPQVRKLVSSFASIGAGDVPKDVSMDEPSTGGCGGCAGGNCSCCGH
jgi:putative FmdB family regulatory protein